jgi:5-methylcytosine-specific restriction enzyme A
VKRGYCERHNSPVVDLEREKRQAMYQTPQWRARRAAQLQAHPLCAEHLRQGRAVPATVADHIKNHCGDPVSFYQGALQSLCRPCHASKTGRESSALRPERS